MDLTLLCCRHVCCECSGQCHVKSIAQIPCIPLGIFTELYTCKGVLRPRKTTLAFLIFLLAPVLLSMLWEIVIPVYTIKSLVAS